MVGKIDAEDSSGRDSGRPGGWQRDFEHQVVVMIYKSRKEMAKTEVKMERKIVTWNSVCLCMHTRILGGWTWQMVQNVEKWQKGFNDDFYSA